MQLDRLAMASILALGVALAFYPAQRFSHTGRTLVWLVCSVAVGLTPCLISIDANPVRLLATLLSIGLLPKLYDLNKAAGFGLHLRPWSYVVYLPNFFWLVLRREPIQPPMKHDLWRLGPRALAALLSVIVCRLPLAS